MKNKRNFSFISCLTALFIWLISCTNQQAKPVALTVSAAGVYRDAIAEVGNLYKQTKPNVTITYNIAGSGFLRKQIEQGAPVDIYISGIQKEMDGLEKKGLIIPETRQNLTQNNIVLIVPSDSTLALSNFKDVAKLEVKRVALGNDKVSAGIYTKDALTSLGIYEEVKKKGVFAEEDIRQVLKYVEAKSVDVGITYETEGKISEQVKIVAIAPANSHEPVISPVAVLKNSLSVNESKDFIQFLKSEEAATVFEKYGFTIIK